MTREAAARLVPKLRAVSEQRGATGPEATLAAAKARRLEQRYGLAAAPRRAAARARGRRRPRFVATPLGEVYGPSRLDAKTGAPRPNVRVHHRRGIAALRIEIAPLEHPLVRELWGYRR